MCIYSHRFFSIFRVQAQETGFSVNAHFEQVHRKLLLSFGLTDKGAAPNRTSADVNTTIFSLLTLSNNYDIIALMGVFQMNFMITGSNGFVGSKLMYALEAIGHKTIGIDISDECPITPHVNTLHGDIRKSVDLARTGIAFIERYNESIDMVIHCAAAKHDFGIDRSEYFSHNKYGTKTLLEYMSSQNIQKLMYISTVSVFGHPVGEADESQPYAPDHPYGDSKLAGEILSINWHKEEQTRELLVLRPTVIYGPHSHTNVYNLIDMLHRRPWITIGKGNHIKSVVSLDNIIDMIVFSLGIMKPGMQDFNCVDEPYISLHELMRLISSNAGFRMPRFTIPQAIAIAIGKLFDIPAKLLSIDLPVNSDRMRKLSTATYFKAQKIRDAGYVQRRSTQECVSEMCTWYLKSGRKKKV